ncbi:MAG TPA: SGNH/GDSL hydrolase family protein [Planctomycetota bacterium]|nr:SGNH/GDSL hydrolase family protein [Planctomycetota bacterium]
MTLLATSTPEKRNKVRILFYGQSITNQEWTKFVSEDLRKRFPNADLEIENKSLGGFASQILVRIAEHDVYPFYPDLVIFHVYGANNTYEEIIANIRKRTTAEVVMQRDHVTQWPPEKPDQKKDGGMWWDHMMNNVFLPDYAKKYGCGLVDIRGQWLEYLKTNSLEPKALLSDNVHLNEHGNYLLGELVKRYLVYKPELPADSWKELVKTYEVGKDVQWKDGKLQLEFDGNRVDMIADKGEGTADVRIDGKKPSEFPELYVITRPSNSQTGFWPAILRVSWEKPLQLEDWTLKIIETNPEATKFSFELSGSKTGPDGSGTNETKFVSKSGRAIIEPGDWWVKNAYQITKKPLTNGFQIKWSVKPMFVDTYQAPKVEDPSREVVTTLAQGLSNGKHTLELSGKAPIKAIRVYRPPYK